MFISVFMLLGAMPVYASEGTPEDIIITQNDIDIRANTYSFGKKTISKD